MPYPMVMPKFDVQDAAFNALVTKYGYKFTWQQATICPCRNTETDSPTTTCSLCSGRGWYYFGSTQILGVMMSLTSNKAFNSMGEIGDWLLGKAQLTYLATNKLGYRDRLTNIDSVINYSQVIKRGSASLIDDLRYKAISTSLIRTVSDTYVLTTDYVVTAGGDIQWVGTHKPTVGTYYTILYQCNPVWINLEYLHIVRDSYQTETLSTPVNALLPRQTVVGLEFLL